MDTVSSQRCDPFTEHCMYVISGPLTEMELIDYIERVVKDVEAEISIRNQHYASGGLFKVNMPTNKQGEGVGYAFAWFTRKEVFFMLSGRDYDGAVIVTDYTQTPMDDLLNDDWSEPIRVNRMYVIPDNEDNHTPLFKPAYADRVPEGDAEGVLFCDTVLPDTITDDDLSKLFVPFVTTGELEITRTRRGNAYVRFSNVDDAYFALMMMKKHRFGDMMLCFSHSWSEPPKLLERKVDNDRRGGRAGNKGSTGSRGISQREPAGRKGNPRDATVAPAGRGRGAKQGRGRW